MYLNQTFADFGIAGGAIVLCLNRALNISRPVILCSFWKEGDSSPRQKSTLMPDHRLRRNSISSHSKPCGDAICFISTIVCASSQHRKPPRHSTFLLEGGVHIHILGSIQRFTLDLHLNMTSSPPQNVATCTVRSSLYASGQH